MGLDILLWIGLALAAGFIGYFGRYPAKILLDKILKKQSSPDDDIGPPRDLPTTPEERVAQSQLKVEKKKAKQEVKKAKKAAKK